MNAAPKGTLGSLRRLRTSVSLRIEDVEAHAASFEALGLNTLHIRAALVSLESALHEVEARILATKEDVP